MAERLTFNTSKLGHSLGQISKLTGLTIQEVKETLGQATGLTPKDVIFHMRQKGLSLEQITQETGVELEVLKQYLPGVIGGTVETHKLI
jgi:lambda repressor-like predicted transcriptional regulator